jgi:CRP-like cAMP-binding protein
MANSDKKLRSFARYRTKIGAKMFAGIVEGGQQEDGVEHRTSLIERAFRDLDPDNKGYVTTDDVIRATGEGSASDDGGKHQLSLSAFSDLLAESMKNRYFDRGEVIYREGDIGNHMYYIDSGTVSVETSTGSIATRKRGDFFGEGALLHPQKIRSATIRCKTPVHAMEISREYFEKYMKDSDEKLFLELTEKDKIRKRNRSKMILRTQQNLIKRKFRKGQMLFKKGQRGESIFLVEQGKVSHVIVRNPRLLLFHAVAN